MKYNGSHKNFEQNNYENISIFIYLRKYVALFILEGKKGKKKKIYDLYFYLKKNSTVKRKEIIKIRAEINKIENTQMIKLTNLKAGSVKKSTKLIFFKSILKLTTHQKDRIQITNIRSERRIITDSKTIKNRLL